LVRSLRQALAPLPELERSMTFKYHIFLSHSSQNKPIARLVAHELKHAGFDVWFDEWMIALGDDIFLEIERGIEQSRAMMVLLSPPFLQSDWAKMERSAGTFRDPVGLERPIFPVIVEKCELPDSLKRVSHFDLTEPSTPRLQSLITTLAFRLGLAGKEKAPFNSQLLAETGPGGGLAESTSTGAAYERLLLAANAVRRSALIFVDVDGFSYINAKHGVPTAEKILERLARLLQAGLPAEAFSERWRADEFIVFVPNVEERAALSIASELARSVSEFDWSSLSKDLYVSISCGVAGRTQRRKTIDVEWIERAMLGSRATKLRGGARARIGEYPQSTESERIRKSLNPLGYLRMYGS
jgi:diguanylate cyclase (GGDEF)-like protein